MASLRTEHLSSPLRSEPLAAPELLFGISRSHEKYEITVLAIRAQHGHRSGLRDAREIEEVAVGTVPTTGSVIG
jgi:RNA:NAD 2'-phosphotransferase (TPT1/KptA family)